MIQAAGRTVAAALGVSVASALKWSQRLRETGSASSRPMAELERERAEVPARLAQAPPVIPDIHPGIAEICKRKAARLTDTLSDPETRLDASSDIRSLAGRIILHPGDKRGEVHATLHGSLMGISDFVNDNPQPEASRI